MTTCSYCGSDDHTQSTCPWKERNMKLALTLFAALALTGCTTLDGKLENRIACTVAKDKAFIVSEYGPVGISATVSPKDAAVVCK